MTMSRTTSSSKASRGAYASLSLRANALNSSKSSEGKTRSVEYRPCRSAFREEAALPAGVLGPVLFFAFSRFAAICFSEDVFIPLTTSVTFTNSKMESKRHRRGDSRIRASTEFRSRLYTISSAATLVAPPAGRPNLASFCLGHPIKPIILRNGSQPSTNWTSCVYTISDTQGAILEYETSSASGPENEPILSPHCRRFLGTAMPCDKLWRESEGDPKRIRKCL